jgi:nicotinamidase-related amidase
VKIADKTGFLERSTEALGDIYDQLKKLPSLKLNALSAEQTALVIIDMINGFSREGALKSPRVAALIPVIAKLSEECDRQSIIKLAFADSHTGRSPEFDAYPPHCMAGMSESEIVEELKAVGGYLQIPKNSTNGFIEKNFQEWLKQNSGIRNFIITGDCTDICIQQFAVTLKTWFNMQDESSRIIVPVNAVDTFDLGLHDADLLNVVTLYSMSGNGIELVSAVEV